MIRYLDGSELRRVLTMEATIAALEEVLRDAARGLAGEPGRLVVSQSREGEAADCATLTMPATWSGREVAGVKVVTYVADNPAAGRPAVQGLALLIDAATGSPRLLVDAGALTARRTGALVGLGCRHLARRDARILGLVGTGALADDLIAGVRAERAIERVMLHNRSRGRAEEVAGRCLLDAEVVDRPEDLAGADVLVTATSSREPVIADGAIAPGTHVAAVGNFSPEGRELEGATVAGCRRFVDSLENALDEAGELILAAREGLIPPGEEGVEGDLVDLVSGEVEGRRDDLERTLFKSVGTTLADVAGLVAAERAAAETGIGVELRAGC